MGGGGVGGEGGGGGGGARARKSKGKFSAVDGKFKCVFNSCIPYRCLLP